MADTKNDLDDLEAYIANELLCIGIFDGELTTVDLANTDAALFVVKVNGYRCELTKVTRSRGAWSGNPTVECTYLCEKE